MKLQLKDTHPNRFGNRQFIKIRTLVKGYIIGKCRDEIWFNVKQEVIHTVNGRTSINLSHGNPDNFHLHEIVIKAYNT